MVDAGTAMKGIVHKHTGEDRKKYLQAAEATCGVSDECTPVPGGSSHPSACCRASLCERRADAFRADNSRSSRFHTPW